MADVVFAFCPRCGRPLVDAERDGLVRRVCEGEGCGFVHYGNPTPVVAAIVERSDGVVLVQSVGWPAEWFGLVTGFLERGETPEEGALREVREELGLSGRVESLVGVYAFPQRNEVIIAFHVTAEGEIVRGDELAAHKVVPVGKLRPWPFATGDAVRDWLAKRGG